VSHTVRPRWTWTALVVLVVGLVLVGVGVVVMSWLWALIGLALLVVGGAAAVHGGFLYDVRGGASVREHVEEVEQGVEFEFPGAGTRRSQDEVERGVRERWSDDPE
jgi:hypothetical protein